MGPANQADTYKPGHLSAWKSLILQIKMEGFVGYWRKRTLFKYD